MKKDLIFTPALLLVGVLLFLLKTTGMTAHIVISIVGILLLAAYTVLSKKEWKCVPLEIIMRAFYGIALITGVVIMNIHGIAALAIIHKISALLFLVMIVILLSSKLFDTKKS